jgi:hypothetical protein
VFKATIATFIKNTERNYEHGTDDKLVERKVRMLPLHRIGESAVWFHCPGLQLVRVTAGRMMH